MKTEDQVNKFINDIMSMSNCNEKEAAILAEMFIKMLINQIKKMQFLNEEPQIAYWKDVLKKINKQ